MQNYSRDESFRQLTGYVTVALQRIYDDMWSIIFGEEQPSRPFLLEYRDHPRLVSSIRSMIKTSGIQVDQDSVIKFVNNIDIDDLTARLMFQRYMVKQISSSLNISFDSTEDLADIYEQFATVSTVDNSDHIPTISLPPNIEEHEINTSIITHKLNHAVDIKRFNEYNIYRGIYKARPRIPVVVCIPDGSDSDLFFAKLKVKIRHSKAILKKGLYYSPVLLTSMPYLLRTAHFSVKIKCSDSQAQQFAAKQNISYSHTYKKAYDKEKSDVTMVYKHNIYTTFMSFDPAKCKKGSEAQVAAFRDLCSYLFDAQPYTKWFLKS